MILNEYALIDEFLNTEGYAEVTNQEYKGTDTNSEILIENIDISGEIRSYWPVPTAVNWFGLDLDQPTTVIFFLFFWYGSM